jgi:Phosphotransferase enzyme family
MTRTVSALVTWDEAYVGTIGPFPVDVPFWAEAGPVVDHLTAALGVPVLVLRLLGVEGGEGARDGHVTYHAAALTPPPAGIFTGRPGAQAFLSAPEPLRSPWARLAGIREYLDWACDTLAAAGRPVTGPAIQCKTWNLAALFQLPTDKGPAWLKATPSFATDEASVIAALAQVDPTLVPPVLGAAPGRVLLDHIPGEDCWDASAEIIASGIDRFVAAQAALAPGRVRPDRIPPDHMPPGLPDRRAPVLAGQIRALLDGPVAGELTARELAAAHGLLSRFQLLDACGLPDTLVHGDFHSGNWRSDGGPPVVVDFADAHLGNPVLDGLRVCDFLPEDKRSGAARAWIDAWTSRVPGADPARALAVAEPLAHLTYAVRYQEFLDGIEPSERVYHHGDPAASIRAALRSATGLGLGPGLGGRADPGRPVPTATM